MKTGSIYGLQCPLEKRIVYVGQTAQPLCKRLGNHKSASKNAVTRPSKKIQWLRGLSEKGLLNSVRIICLQDCIELHLLNKRELYWIGKMQSEGELLNDERKVTYSRIEFMSIERTREITRKKKKKYKNRTKSTKPKYSLSLKRRPDFEKWINTQAA